MFFPLRRRVGSEWALEMAKYNLAHNYLVVGTTDQLEEVVAVLEAVLPRFFSGALEFFVTGNIATFLIYANICGRRKQYRSSSSRFV